MNFPKVERKISNLLIYPLCIHISTKLLCKRSVQVDNPFLYLLDCNFQRVGIYPFVKRLSYIYYIKQINIAFQSSNKYVFNNNAYFIWLTLRSSCFGKINIVLPSMLKTFPFKLINSPSATLTISPEANE